MNVLIAHVEPMIRDALRIALAGIDARLRVLVDDFPQGADEAARDAILAVVGLGQGGAASASTSAVASAATAASAAAPALDLIPRLRARTPALPIVVLADPGSEAAHRARALGTVAVISPRACAPAVRATVQALLPAATEAAARVPLTPRQAEVLALIAQGKPNKLICRELRLSEGTVKVHVSAVLRAFNVANRTQAVLAAQHHRLHVADRRRCRPG